MDFPFRCPDYAKVAAFFDERVGKSRSAKIDDHENATRAYWQLPRTSRDGDYFDGHYVTRDAHGALAWMMHRTPIVEWLPDGRRYINHGGWLHTCGTRDALNALTGVRTRVLPERVFQGRLDTLDRLLASGYSHGVPFTGVGMYIDPDGTPIPPLSEHGRGYTEFVRVTDEPRRQAALAFIRRMRKIAAPIVAVWPDTSNGHADVFLGSTQTLRNRIGAFVDAATEGDVALSQALVEWLQKRGASSPHNAGTLISNALQPGVVYEVFDVYSQVKVATSELDKYLPQMR